MKRVDVGKQQLPPELEARFAAIEARAVAAEARLEKLDSTPRAEVREPYRVGSKVYSIVDREARNPLTVVGYERGRILVTSPDDANPRSLPLESVTPLEQCARATPTPSQIYEHMDPKSREYFEARREAEIRAKTKPFTPPIPQQVRYSDRNPFEVG